MRMRSTGSAEEDEGDDPRTNADVAIPTDERAGGSSTKLLNSPSIKELRNLPTTARQSLIQSPSFELDRRKSTDKRPSAARIRRPSNTNWKPSEQRNANLDKQRSAEPSVIGVPSKEALAVDKMADSRPVTRRARLRSPWAASLLIFVTTALAALLLFSIIHSFTSQQLDCKGCRMSYMRPSFAKLSDFDTEHTRFASKYSVYLYREGMVDEDTKVCMVCRKAGPY